MKKLVIKTALITFGAAIAFCLLLYLCFAAFAPTYIVDFYRDLGNDELALKYSVRAYQKDNKSTKSLLAVIDCAINANDDQSVILYSNELFLGDLSDIDQEYLSRLQGRYCRSLAKTDKKQESANKAASFTADYLTTDAGAKLKLLPIEDLIVFAAEQKDQTFLNQIYLCVCEVKAQRYEEFCEKGKARIDEDILKLSTLPTIENKD